MYLLCTSPRRRVLARLPLSRLPSRVREVIRRLGLFAQRSTSSHLSREEDMLDRAREDPDDEDLSKKTPWPRGGPRCCAQACLGRAFQSIENRLHFDMCHAVSRPGLFELLIAAQAPPHRTPSKVRKQTFPQGIPACVGNLEKSEHRNLLCL